MKHLLLSLLLALCCLSAGAQTYGYLTLRTGQDHAVSFSSEALKLTFASGQVTVSGAGQAATFPLSQLTSMAFTTEAAGIHDVSLDSRRVTILNGRLRVEGAEGAPVSLWSSDGRSLSPEALLPRGVYMVRVGGQTFKVLAR